MKKKTGAFLYSILVLSLATVMFMEMFIGFQKECKARAESTVDVPTFRLRKVNHGTGVRIVINKTKGAKGYYIYISNVENEYSSYLFNNGEYNEEYLRWVGEIEKDGSAKRSYTVKGLPEGTYCFKVRAYTTETVYNTQTGEDDSEYVSSDYSIEKKITVKAAKPVKTTEKEYDFSEVKVGDIIKFGSYEQDDIMTNGKEEIEWIVLSKDSKRMLILSKYALDSLPYNNEKSDITWENCTLRKWLNEMFYNVAFTEKERSMINTVKLSNQGSSESGNKEENETKDRVFLLSLDDVINAEFGFNADSSERDINRRCGLTEYAAAQGTHPYYGSYSGAMTAEGKGSCWWLLRSSDIDEGRVIVMHRSGSVYHYGICDPGSGVRPALYISIKSENS